MDHLILATFDLDTTGGQPNYAAVTAALKRIKLFKSISNSKTGNRTPLPHNTYSGNYTADPGEEAIQIAADIRARVSAAIRGCGETPTKIFVLATPSYGWSCGT